MQICRPFLLPFFPPSQESMSYCIPSNSPLTSFCVLPCLFHLWSVFYVFCFLFVFPHHPFSLNPLLEKPLQVRHRPGIYFCPSSPTLPTDTLSFAGSDAVVCGHGSGHRITNPPLSPISYNQSDSALLRKSVSFNEDLLLAASGIVGQICVIELKKIPITVS